MSEPKFIDPCKLRPGPIRNESLPAELFEQVEAEAVRIAQAEFDRPKNWNSRGWKEKMKKWIF